MKLQCGLPVLQAVCMYIMSTACSNPVLEVECSGSWPACAQCERVRPCTLCRSNASESEGAQLSQQWAYASQLYPRPPGSEGLDLGAGHGRCGEPVVLALASLGMFPCTHDHRCRRDRRQVSGIGDLDLEVYMCVCLRACMHACVLACMCTCVLFF